MASLCRTENIKTGAVRYYVDGKRVSEDKFDLFLFWKTQDCLHTVRTKKLIKSYSHVR